ncbi:MAG: carbonic anhydrase [Methylovulum sp.]|jgi:MFS superfamily sulfate permease-like transporter|nr:carbonic anhydrase [Methylovulum sp.]
MSLLPTPSPSFVSSLKNDIPAGLAVFLVAIPLSLGIALASGAPIFSGLIACIIGSLLVAPISGSVLGISGASAGLSVVVLAFIKEFGFNDFLLILVLAGAFQVFMGLVKAGVIAYYFPSSVINGMLTGIGIILLLKQIPHAVGYDTDYEGDLSFFQDDNYSSLTELAHMLNFISPAALSISIISLIVLLVWERIKKHNVPILQWIPSVLMSVIAGVLTEHAIAYYFPERALSPNHLVAIPVIGHPSDWLYELHFPSFAHLDQPAIYLAALTLALVASIETLLAVEAIDKLDTHKRVTPTNRELIAQGIGNMTSGLLGGIPLTQVIIRSSFNIKMGAKSKVSVLFQGGLMLLTVVFIPNWLNQIPLASLAAILIVFAYRLMQPAWFVIVYRAGIYHLVPFCATVLGLVFTNMLTGVLIGLATALFAILLENYKTSFYLREMHIGNKIILRLAEHVSFLNKANIKQTLEQLPTDSKVIIDATRSKYIDYDIYEIIQNFKQEALFKGIQLTIENLRGFGVLPNLITARPPTYQDQQSLTPWDVLELLEQGNENFVNNLKANRNLLEQINDTRQGQFPMAIILSCMDSRTSVELIFDQGLGDVFSVRVAGNVVNSDILGSMEFACKLAGTKLIVVLGHTHCGAIKGACAQVKLDHLTQVLAKIEPAISAVNTEHNITITSDANHEWVQHVANKNVELTVAHILQESQVLNAMVNAGNIAIVGAMYDIETGEVIFNSPSFASAKK